MKKIINKLGYGLSILILVVFLVSAATGGLMASGAGFGNSASIAVSVRVIPAASTDNEGTWNLSPIVNLYSDPACTIPVTSLALNDCEEGDTVSQTVYCKASELNGTTLNVIMTEDNGVYVDDLEWSADTGELTAYNTYPLLIGVQGFTPGEYEFTLTFED